MEFPRLTSIVKPFLPSGPPASPRCGRICAACKPRKLEQSLRRCLREAYELNQSLEDTFNTNWGLLFKARSEHSVFGAQVEDYACIYTSRATNLAQYSPFQYFRTPRDLMPHEQVLPLAPETIVRSD